MSRFRGKANAEKRDNKISKQLATQRNGKVLRFPYDPPLSDKVAREILGVIVEAVNNA